ncbi:hypothetical protein NKI03_07095 [Mesorhizobium sp. M0817]|uniref:hypothetical protein n=1 Tax=unclassified Mesorhizobium TaxID=325217 RepID=UPI00333D8ABC
MIALRRAGARSRLIGIQNPSGFISCFPQVGTAGGRLGLRGPALYVTWLEIK